MESIYKDVLQGLLVLETGGRIAAAAWRPDANMGRHFGDVPPPGGAGYRLELNRRR